MQHKSLNLTVDAIQFINESATADALTGRLTIGHDRTRRDFISYELHWGNERQQKIGTNSLIVDYGLENIGWERRPNYVFTKPLVYDFAETTIPAQACCFLVFVTDVNHQEYLYASRKLVSREHLLPPGATQLERYLAATTGRLSQLPVQIDSLWDPSRCPAQLLPWLAWATSVDIWFDNKDDPVQQVNRRRALIRNNAFVHKHKGTRAAIQKALDAFSNVSITLTEWWQQNPPGAPHTFQLDLLVNNNASGVGNAQLSKKITQTIDAIKPVRSHYSFTISIVQQTPMRAAAASQAISYKRFNMAAVV